MEEEIKPFGKLSGFVLKVIGMVVMTMDHIGIFLMASSSTQTLGLIFRIIGRLAFPIFMFLLAEGMIHTTHPFRYVLRLFGIYALITIVETVMVYGFSDLIGYTQHTLPPHPFTDLVVFGLTLACLKQKGWKKAFAVLPIAVVIASYVCDVYDCFHPSNVNLWFPFYLRVSSGIYGLFIALGFYFAPQIVKLLYRRTLAENNIPPNDFLLTTMGRKAINIVGITLFAIITVVLWGLTYLTPKGELGGGLDMSMQTYALLSTPILYLYNGKRGYDSKPFRIFSYFYFPVHLVILFLLFSL